MCHVIPLIFFLWVFPTHFYFITYHCFSIANQLFSFSDSEINITLIFETVVRTLVIILKIVCLLISIAYFTIAERKIMAAIQRRKGPNVVGFFGLLQPLADGFKLLIKEVLIPTKANAFIFILAPIIILTLSFVG